MNVLIKAVVLSSWEIEVDDVHNVTNVKPTGRDTSGDKDWALASAKGTTADL